MYNLLMSEKKEKGLTIEVKVTPKENEALQYLVQKDAQFKEGWFQGKKLEKPKMRTLKHLWRKGLLEASWRPNRRGNPIPEYELSDQTRRQLEMEKRQKTLDVKLDKKERTVLEAIHGLWSKGKIGTIAQISGKLSKYQNDIEVKERQAVTNDKIAKITGMSAYQVGGVIHTLGRRGFVIPVKEYPKEGYTFEEVVDKFFRPATTHYSQHGGDYFDEIRQYNMPRPPNIHGRPVPTKKELQMVEKDVYKSVEQDLIRQAIKNTNKKWKEEARYYLKGKPKWGGFKTAKGLYWQSVQDEFTYLKHKFEKTMQKESYSPKRVLIENADRIMREQRSVGAVLTPVRKRRLDKLFGPKKKRRGKR